MDAKPFDVIDRTVQADDFNLATVARAGIHFANVQRATEDFVDARVQPAAGRLEGFRDWPRRSACAVSDESSIFACAPSGLS
jgi:hypothetical protein